MAGVVDVVADAHFEWGDFVADVGEHAAVVNEVDVRDFALAGGDARVGDDVAHDVCHVVSSRGNTVSTPFASFGWQIPDYADVQVSDFPTGFSASDYEYRIRAPETTGIQARTTTATTCNWSASGSSWPDESSWRDAETGEVRLIRCGLGNGSTSLTVQMREKSDNSNIDYNSYSTVVNYPWHIPDNNISYIYSGPAAQSDSLPQTTIDSYKAATDQGAAKWNTALGSGRSFTFSKVSSVSSADVVVQGYSSAGGGTDPCGGAVAVACVVYSTGDTYPDFGSQMDLYFEYPPKSEDINGNILSYDWENDFTRATTGAGHELRLYMPIFMAHEFGHTAGLTDLYDEEYGDTYDGYLMKDTYGFEEIPQLDKDYMSQVYRNEHGSEPH